MPGPLNGGWWQVLTSAFTHISILHIGMNMLALWFLGPPLEQVLGRVRFLAVYGISALTASAAVMWLSAPDSVAVGASGAIFGMLVVYCLRGVDLLGPTHGLPELLAGAAVVGLHLWKKNTLLSIAVGTALYMVLVQAVFV